MSKVTIHISFSISVYTYKIWPFFLFPVKITAIVFQSRKVRADMFKQKTSPYLFGIISWVFKIKMARRHGSIRAGHTFFLFFIIITKINGFSFRESIFHLKNAFQFYSFSFLFLTFLFTYWYIYRISLKEGRVDEDTLF